MGASYVVSHRLLDGRGVGSSSSILEHLQPGQVLPDVLSALWNVPQKKVTELTVDVPGVALATPTETREVLARPRASVPQAVLCAVDESKTGVGMDVPVTNGHGKPDSRYRYLFQVGTGTVVLDRSSLQLGARCTAKTVKAVLTLKKGAVSDAMWLRGIALDPEAVAREWLLAQGIKFLEVQRPRATGDGTMRMVLRLNKAAAETLMRMCGRDGVLTGKFIESEEDKNLFASIPLDVSREKALERASFHGAECWGVVPQRNGKG